MKITARKSLQSIKDTKPQKNVMQSDQGGLLHRIVEDLMENKENYQRKKTK